MRQEKTMIMKCCVCGREKTDQGWQYRPRTEEDEPSTSHGLCAPCYEAEIMKVRLQAGLVAAVGLG